VDWTLGRLAAELDGAVVGDPGREVVRVRSLAEAGPDDLAFVSGERGAVAARDSAAGAFLVARGTRGLDGDRIEVADVSLALARALTLLHPAAAPDPGIHPTAIVGDDARIAASASIGPYAVVGRETEIGERAIVGAHAVIGDRCRIGDDTALRPHAVLYDDVRLGKRVLVHSGAVLGADGFGYARGPGGPVKIPQVGGVEVEDDVEIGALSAVDRATLERTVVGSGTKVDNLVQVAHNVRIGSNSILCGQAGIGGSARLGRGVVLAGQAGVIDHVELGDGVQVAAKSAAFSSVASGTVAGIPAVPVGEWRRRQSVLRRLTGMWRRLRRLEDAVRPGGTDEGGDES